MIGIDDRAVEDQFVQANSGSATFLPWATGQPDNVGAAGGEDCVAELRDGASAKATAACTP